MERREWTEQNEPQTLDQKIAMMIQKATAVMKQTLDEMWVGARKYEPFNIRGDSYIAEEEMVLGIHVQVEGTRFNAKQLKMWRRQHGIDRRNIGYAFSKTAFLDSLQGHSEKAIEETERLFKLHGLTQDIGTHVFVYCTVTGDLVRFFIMLMPGEVDPKVVKDISEERAANAHLN